MPRSKPHCHKCKREIVWRTKGHGRTQYAFDYGGKAWVPSGTSYGLALKSIYLPHACGKPVATDPVARAAETAMEADVRAAFASLAERKPHAP